MSCSDYINFNKRNDPNWFNNNHFQDIPDGYEYEKIVDISGRDMTHLDGVDKALGLVGKRNDKTLTFEEIRDKVKTIDAQRDLIMGDNMEELLKIFKEASAGSNDTINNDDDDDTNEAD